MLEDTDDISTPSTTDTSFWRAIADFRKEPLSKGDLKLWSEAHQFYSSQQQAQKRWRRLMWKILR